MPSLFLRIDFAPRARIGPGKIRLLEAIDTAGSISAAGRDLRMSYRKAWLLVEELNALFEHPVVTTQMGGTRGGGSSLTPFGRDLVSRYRGLEAEVRCLADLRLGPIQAALVQPPVGSCRQPPRPP